MSSITFFVELWGFVKRHWHVVAVAGLAVLAFITFTHWRNHLVDQAHDAGFKEAQAQFTELVNRANKQAAEDQKRLNLMTTNFDTLANSIPNQLTVTLKPTTERIQDEVAKDPTYRTCSVSDSVLHDLQAGRAAVNASIRASAAE